MKVIQGDTRSINYRSQIPRIAIFAGRGLTQPKPFRMRAHLANTEAAGSIAWRWLICWELPPPSASL